MAVRLLLVLAGGGLGSAARYLVGVWMRTRFGEAFPWGTVTVNVVGSFLIGVIAALADDHATFGPNVRLFLIVGVLGGFTTFSSFALETVRLVEEQEPLRALLNVVGSLALTLLAAVLGLAVGRGLGRLV